MYEKVLKYMFFKASILCYHRHTRVKSSGTIKANNWRNTLNIFTITLIFRNSP